MRRLDQDVQARRDEHAAELRRNGAYSLPMTTTTQKLKTVGVSPKAWVPAAAQIAAGIALILLGLDVEGKTLIASGLGTLAVGYGAKPGQVEGA